MDCKFPQEIYDRVSTFIMGLSKEPATSYIEIVKDFYRMQINTLEIISSGRSETFSSGSETAMRNDIIILVPFVKASVV